MPLTHGFLTRQIADMLGVSADRVRGYVRSGVVAPRRGGGGELRFSFQDLVLLRRLEGLITERIPPHRIRHALRKIRGRLPGKRPLTGVHITTEGTRIVVQDDGVRWHPESGQVLLDFSSSRGAPEAPVAELVRARAAEPAPAPPAETEADRIYDQACALESSSPSRAVRLYQKALTLNPSHPDSHVNLGRILHEQGDMTAAEHHYRAALRSRPDDSIAVFNLGVVLEDQQRFDEAVAAYQAAVAVDPGNADAHFNLSRLYDRIGDAPAALRHLRAYQQLTRRPK